MVDRSRKNNHTKREGQCLTYLPTDNADEAEKKINLGGIMWNVEWEQEIDGRWIAEIPVIPGVMAYGTTKEEAIRRVEILALKVLAERLEHGEEIREIHSLFHAV